MSWNAEKASSWLKGYADNLAGDSYTSGGIESLYACAGAAYFATMNGIGYRTQQEFEDFLRVHIEMDEDFIAEAVEEITA